VRDNRTKAQKAIDFQNTGARGPIGITPIEREIIAAREDDATGGSCANCGGSMRCDDQNQTTPSCSRCGREAEETIPQLVATIVRDTLKSTVARVAATYKLSPQRVSIHYDTFSDEDGGEAYSIVLTLPPSDGRQKHDDTLRGFGDDLAAAEADLAKRWETHLVVEAEDAARRKRKR
jgi:hypothetical protein